MKISKELRIGVSALVILVMTYWGITFLKGLDIIKGQNTYYLSVEDASGVSVSTALTVKGYRIGAVTAMQLPELKRNIIVEFVAKSQYAIPKDSYVTVESSGIMDAPTLKLVVGTATEVYKEGDTVRFVPSASMMDKFKTLAGELTAVTEKIKTTLDNVNLLLSEQNIGNISQTISNLNSVTANANKLVVSQQRNIDNILKNAANITKSINEATPEFRAILENINSLSGGLNEKIPQTLTEINTLLSKLNSQDGSVGKLLNDPSVYEHLDQSLANLSVLLEDLKSNPKRYVHFSLFGKKDPAQKAAEQADKEAKKAEKKAAKTKLQ